MKNQVIRNFLVFIGFWLLIEVGINLFQNKPILNNFPWEIFLMFLLALIPVTTQIKDKYAISIDFVVFFVYMIITGGYDNLSSLIVLALMAALLTAITMFIARQFKKGQNL